MKKASFFLILLIIFSVISLGAQVGSRHTERNGNFSFSPPANWTAMTMPGLSYSVFMGPVIGSFQPNMNIVDEHYDGSLPEYVELSILSLRAIFSDASTLQNEVFRTSSGISGFKTVTVYTMSGMQLCAVQYYFSNGSRKYVMTYSALNSNIGDFQGIFDESARTFQFLR